MAELEEGGMFDEDTMPDWMKTMRGVAVSRPHAVLTPTAQPPPSLGSIPPPAAAVQQPPTSFSEVVQPPPGLPPGEKCFFAEKRFCFHHIEWFYLKYIL